MPPVAINMPPTSPWASVATWVVPIVVAVLTAALTTYLARRREPDQWFWRRQMETYEDALERARYLLLDASETEADPMIERDRPLPSQGRNDQAVTAALGMFGSTNARVAWARVIEAWEEHSRIATTNLRQTTHDIRLLERGRDAERELEAAYESLVSAVQLEARRRPGRPKRYGGPTKKELALGRHAPQSARAGAEISDEDGVSVFVKRLPKSGNSNSSTK